MDGGTSTSGAHTDSVCVSGEKRGRCMPGVVPVMAERASMFEWNSGVFCLTVKGTQALTGGTGNQRNDPGPRGRARGCAISSIHPCSRNRDHNFGWACEQQ